MYSARSNPLVFSAQGRLLINERKDSKKTTIPGGFLVGEEELVKKETGKKEN